VVHALLTRLRIFDAHEAWGPMGFTSCAHWLSWRAGIGLKTAREKASAEAAPEASAEAFVEPAGPAPEASAEAFVQPAAPTGSDSLEQYEEQRANAIVDVARAYIKHRPRTLGSGYELVLISSKEQLEHGPGGVGGFPLPRGHESAHRPEHQLPKVGRHADAFASARGPHLRQRLFCGTA